MKPNSAAATRPGGSPISASIPAKPKPWISPKTKATSQRSRAGLGEPLEQPERAEREEPDAEQRAGGTASAPSAAASAAASRPAPSASMMPRRVARPDVSAKFSSATIAIESPISDSMAAESGCTTPSTPSASVTLCATVKPVTIVATSTNEAPSSSSASRKTR